MRHLVHALATTVGQQFAAALAGSTTVDEALNNAQRITERAMKKARYIE